MTKPPEDNYPLRTVENVAVFGSVFTLGELSAYAGSVLHGPQSPDFTLGDAVVVGLVISGIATAAYDRLKHTHDKDE